MNFRKHSDIMFINVSYFENFIIQTRNANIGHIVCLN